MKILTISQIKEADKYTLQNEPISSINLMERASYKFVNWLLGHFIHEDCFYVFCGPGNNGGDGLAVARILNGKGKIVKAFLIGSEDKLSTDCSINFKRLEAYMKIEKLKAKSNFPNIENGAIIVDALFGSGLRSPLTGLYDQVVNFINAQKNTIVSIDIASGLFADRHTSTQAPVIAADFTISFQTPKLAFMMPENHLRVGEWRVVDIGLHPAILEQLHTPHTLLSPTELPKLKKRKKYQHKSNFGKALLVAGSYGKMGAAVLASKACLRSGIGLLTVHVPQCGYQILQSTAPEAMVSIDESDHYFNSDNFDTSSYDCVGIGPGLNQKQETVKALKELLKKVDKPLVLDADALNILADNPKILELVPEESILTPHFGEFKRLLSDSKNDFERLEKQRQFSQQHGLILVLKGAHTSISDPYGNVYFNNTGNPGMATGGSGDVLTGIITSLLSQKYQPLEAALLGVYIHGLSGDMVAHNLGMESLTAGDLVSYLPEAFKVLNGY